MEINNMNNMNNMNMMMRMEEMQGELRERIQYYLDMHMYPSAQFFADKLMTLSNGSTASVYLFARTLFLSREYHRAFDLLHRSSSIKQDPKCLYLAAKCKAELSLWEDCIDLLGDEEESEEEWFDIGGEGEGGRGGDGEVGGKMKMNGGSKDHRTEAALCLLRGRAFEFKENRERATYWFVRALKHDPHCVDALATLTNHHLLTSSAEKEIVQKLKFPQKDSWVKPLYNCLLKKYDQNPTTAFSAQGNGAEGGGGGMLARFEKNNDVVTASAEYEFYKNNFRKSYALTKQILDKDPYNHGAALVVHISILVELKSKSELFDLCHKLVEGSGHTSIAWYGVGCYYFLLKNYENARRYFNKSTSIEPHFGPAWMGFGHSFAAQGEHDQAMAAYRTAARILEGSHHPPLSIGTELIRVCNLPLASQYLQQAKLLCPSDPLIYNELGVIHYMNKEYTIAIEFFQKVLEICEAADFQEEGGRGGLARSATLSPSWDPTVMNLAHCYRKLGSFEQAVQYYEISLSLNPFDDHTASTYASLGYTQHLMGHIEMAIEYYHQSLAIKDDSFTSTMLTKALEDLLDVPPTS